MEDKREHLKFKGKIYLIANERDWKRAYDHFIDIIDEAHANSTPQLVGLDTETRPSFKRGEVYQVALLQLATADTAFIFKLHSFHLPGPVLHLLEDPMITKIGLAIHDDIKALKKVYSFKEENTVDVAKMAKAMGYTQLGLQSLTEILFDKTLSKKAKLSNWEARELTFSQIEYAATDAWVTREIYVSLHQKSTENSLSKSVTQDKI